MAQAIFPMLQLILSLLFILTTAVFASPSTKFIEASCKTTTYPANCVKSLSPYSVTIKKSSRKMAQTALIVAQAQAQTGKALVDKLIKVKGLKVKEYKALNVCLDQMGENVDRLNQSVKELKLVGKNNSNNVSWQISNVQTWVSAALTDQMTCLDAFEERGLNGKTKNMINSRVTNIKKVTSNALALVNKFSLENTN